MTEIKNHLIEVPLVTMNISMFSLIFTAKKFLEAARIVAAEEGKQGAGWHPVGKYLACQSIELSLKAFLSLSGRSMEDVERFQHRIAELLAVSQKANLRGLVRLAGNEITEIKKAAKYYSNGGSVFRYPDIFEIARKYPDDPDVAPLLSAAEKLVDGLYYPCRAAA